MKIKRNEKKLTHQDVANRLKDFRKKQSDKIRKDPL